MKTDNDILDRLQEYSVYGDDAKVRIMAALAKAEIERLRALAQTGAPVAWMNYEHIDAYRAGKRDGIAWAAPDKSDFYNVALYAAPQPASDAQTPMDSSWTPEQIIKGVRDAAAFCDCSSHPDAPEMAGACRLAAHELSGRAQPPMAADIEQILWNGYADGKTRAEIAEEILREWGHAQGSVGCGDLTFGTFVENIAASDRNPIKRGIFIRKTSAKMAEYATKEGCHSTPLDNLRVAPSVPSTEEKSPALPETGDYEGTEDDLEHLDGMLDDRERGS